MPGASWTCSSRSDAATAILMIMGELTGARKAEFAASRRSLGVRERTFLQHTPQGDLVLVTLEGDHPETAFAEFGKRTDPFTMWFKQQVSEIHGMAARAAAVCPGLHRRDWPSARTTLRRYHPDQAASTF